MISIQEKFDKKHGNLPAKVLQVGEGNFLRAFADWMIDTMNDKGIYNSTVQIIQVTPRRKSQVINEQNGMYTVIKRGVLDGKVVNTHKIITSVRSCLNVYEDYNGFLGFAEEPDFKVIISNTTEAGIVYHEGDKYDDCPPHSFPAKMTVFLHHRYRKFNGAADKGFLFLPVELIENNGSSLKRIIIQYAKEWELEQGFIDWIENCNHFANTLVDRIVSGYPSTGASEMEKQLGYSDKLLDVCEPFHSWIIEGDEKWSELFPADKAGLQVHWVKDQSIYRTRKVRLLNGAHTVSAMAAYLAGHNIVLDMVEDRVFRKYLDLVLHKEIMPTIDMPVDMMEEFVGSVMERFSNPFINHELLSIALNSTSKFKSRCLPSLLDYNKKFGKLPPILTFSLAALICFYKGEKKEDGYFGNRNGEPYKICDDDSVINFFEGQWREFEDSEKLAGNVLGNEAVWGQDLNQVTGLTGEVSKYLNAILQNGAYAAAEGLINNVGSEI